MGYVEHDMLHTTTEGTPQGGLVSPLLANIALCGMEEEIGIVYKKDIQTKWRIRNRPKM